MCLISNLAFLFVFTEWFCLPIVSTCPRALVGSHAPRPIYQDKYEINHLYSALLVFSSSPELPGAIYLEYTL